MPPDHPASSSVDDRLDGIAYWREVTEHQDDVLLDRRIDGELGTEWTPYVELDDHTDARGGVVHLTGASFRAEAVGEACAMAVAGRPMRVFAVATPIPEDRFAVSIHAEPGGVADADWTHLGYLPREVARLVCDDVESGNVAVFPVVYLPAGRGKGRPGMRLVVARRASAPRPEFPQAALDDVRLIRRPSVPTQRLPRPAGTTPYEHWLGMSPDAVIRHAVDQVRARIVRIVPDEDDLAATIRFPVVEGLVDRYTDRELVAAAAAWAVDPHRMAADLGSELRSMAGSGGDALDLDGLAAATAERWRRHVAQRLVARDAGT